MVQHLGKLDPLSRALYKTKTVAKLALGTLAPKPKSDSITVGELMETLKAPSSAKLGDKVQTKLLRSSQ